MLWGALWRARRCSLRCSGALWVALGRSLECSGVSRCSAVPWHLQQSPLPLAPEHPLATQGDFRAPQTAPHSTLGWPHMQQMACYCSGLACVASSAWPHLLGLNCNGLLLQWPRLHNLTCLAARVMNGLACEASAAMAPRAPLRALFPTSSSETSVSAAMAMAPPALANHGLPSAAASQSQAHLARSHRIRVLTLFGKPVARQIPDTLGHPSPEAPEP